MTKRYKFTCQSMTKKRHYNIVDTYSYSAEFRVAQDGSEDPLGLPPWGFLKVGTYKDDVFEVGKDYYLDIVEA